MSAPAGTEAFYADLPAQERFEALAEAACYARVPNDWTVVLTDVRDSTRAIDAGRYKDVNTLGAASIVAARRVLGGLEVPFAFGGDGATLLVPAARAPAVLGALEGLRGLARERFGLDLRVGSVPVSALEAAGTHVEVAKHAVSPHCRVASLRGEGLRVAEQRIKDAAGEAGPGAAPPPEPDLSGLSCRWKPFTSRRGTVLTLIVEARHDGTADPAATFPRVLSQLQQLLPEGLEQANPAAAGLRGYRRLRENLRAERLLQRRALSLSFLKRLLETTLATFAFAGFLPLPALKRYMRDTPTHCDYRKFDRSLRAVLDCSPSEAEAIERMLAREHAAGTLHYGLHRAPEALMTCLVEGLAPGQHLHFIDGAGGGYALAAARLKAQQRGLQPPP